MKNYLLATVLMCLAVVNLAFAQTRTITGTVTSAEDGEPLPAVSVQLKGTTTGAVTDFNGKYSINVPQDGGVLVFSFIGLNTQEVRIGNQNVIDVQMSENVKELGEIVVTGVAAAVPAKKLAFTVGSADERILQQAPASDAGSALAGKIAGVRVQPSNVPGGGPAIQLRGATSLRTGSGPLIVLDGMLIEGTLANINLQDVERMEVLKGASAATLFGSRAANGVIQIFTKRGDKLKAGTTEIMVRNEVGFENIYSSRAPEKARHHSFALNPDGTIQVGSNGLGIPSPISIARNPFPVYYNHLDLFFTGTTRMTNYARIVSRGQNTNYMVSFEHQNEAAGIELHDGNRRYNARFNSDTRIGSRLTLSSSFIYTYTINDDRPRPLFNLIMMDPSADLFAPNPNGEPFLALPNKFSNQGWNPFYQLVNNLGSSERRRMVGNFKANVEIAPGLTAQGDFGVDTWDNKSRSFQEIGYLAREGTPGVGSIGRGYSEVFAIVASGRLTYVKKFGDLSIRSNFFYQYEDRNNSSFSVSGTNLGVRGFFDIFSNVKLSPQDSRPFLNASNSNTSQIRADNFSLAVDGDYKDRYLFSLVGRRDGVSLFGPEARWANFYRASLGYRITEDFTIPGFQELKLAGSIGTAGGRPNFLDRFEFASITNGNLNFPTQLANPFLRPNITTEIEVTLNAEFLNRWTFMGSYSFQENADQILAVPLSAITGRATQIQNAGTLETNTIELTLGYKAIDTRDMGLDFTLIWDRTRQDITKFDRPDQQAGGLSLWRREGGPLTAMYGRKFVRRIEDLTLRPDGTVANVPGNLKPEDFVVNREGFVVRRGTEFTPNEEAIQVTDQQGIQLDNILIGDAQPDWNASLLTNFRYKRFGVWMQWEYQHGGNVYQQGAQWLARDQLHPMFDQSMYPEGQQIYTRFWSSLYNVNRYSDFWIYDATHWRLRELAFNVQISNNDMNKLGVGKVFKSAQFSFIGRNLLLFSDYPGFDPATGGFQTRIDDFNFPLVRSYSAALTLNF
jgi:TonB-linked SusC/RagA family outer membrane protein